MCRKPLVLFCSSITSFNVECLSIKALPTAHLGFDNLFGYCYIWYCHLESTLLDLHFPHAKQISDISVEDYITATAARHATYMPHTAGRYQVKRFRKAQCPIVERLTNSLMMHGRNNGKKLMAVRIVKHAMEIIHLLTDLNPIQVIVDAVINRYLICFPFLFLFFLFSLSYILFIHDVGVPRECKLEILVL